MAFMTSTQKNTLAAAIFSIFAEHRPHPSTELVYHTPFELLVAVILSAQSTDVSVNRVTTQLFAHANTPEAIVQLGEEQLQELIKKIGLYRAKAKHIIQTAQLLIDKYQSEVPSTRQALESLPGVGRKTANVVLNTLFDEPTLAVDTHVFRVARRIGLSTGTTPLAVEQDLLACIPDDYLKKAHHWLILHGRYICKAKNPLCNQCPIHSLCEKSITR